MPRTFKNVSCCPANDASGRSSAVAEDRTANEASPSAPTRRSYADRSQPPNQRERLGDDGVADLLAGPGQFLHVVGVQAASRLLMSRPDGVADEAAVGLGGRGEPVRHAPPGWRDSTPFPREKSSSHRPARGRPGSVLRTRGRCWTWERPDASKVLEEPTTMPSSSECTTSSGRDPHRRFRRDR